MEAESTSFRSQGAGVRFRLAIWEIPLGVVITMIMCKELCSRQWVFIRYQSNTRTHEIPH